MTSRLCRLSRRVRAPSAKHYDYNLAMLGVSWLKDPIFKACWNDLCASCSNSLYKPTHHRDGFRAFPQEAEPSFGPKSSKPQPGVSIYLAQPASKPLAANWCRSIAG